MLAWFAIILMMLLPGVSLAQVIISDFLVNDVNQNLKGLGRPAVAAHSNGNFAVAWQDFNDYQNPVSEQPRVAVQLFSAAGTPVGPTNLFRGESRGLSIWTSDFLEPNPDLAFLPDGTLLVAVEHEGRFHIGGDDVGSSEVGIGVVDASGQILDATPNNVGVILWLISTATSYQENPRIAAAPQGNFFVALNGPTYDTRFHAVLIQAFDENGNFDGDFFTPHPGDSGPQFNHRFPDVATNGSLHAVVWQDGRGDANFDITIQFYSNTGEIGGNQKVNAGDPPGTINIWPSIAMNAAGNSVVVWADTRTGQAGEIFGQLFNANGQPVGGNFQISAGDGEIYDRPEAAMLNDGSFMVVWTDSMFSAAGLAAFRARARQFGANGLPLGSTFVVPNQDGPSGLINIATDGADYFCTWLDDRQGTEYLNIYAKVMSGNVTSVAEDTDVLPKSVRLFPAYPNPFNPSTTIRYSLSEAAAVTLQIFDTEGRLVSELVSGQKEAGVYSTQWNGRDRAGRPVASGIYFYRLEAAMNDGRVTQLSRKVTLLK